MSKEQITKKNDYQNFMICDPGYFLPRDEWEEACKTSDHKIALRELVERHGGKMLGSGDDGIYLAYIDKRRIEGAEDDYFLGALTVDSGNWAVLPYTDNKKLEEWMRAHPFGMVVTLSVTTTVDRLAKDVLVRYKETDNL